jgi:type II restriction enzyme
MAHSKKAQDIYEKMQSANITSFSGHIEFTLGNLSVQLETMDIVGGAIQEWFGQWLKDQNFKFTTPINTQSFPDFILGANDYLEVKCFNFSAGPAFDIANYGAYIESLLINPERLDASYLIFGYSMTNREIKIEKIWMKNIWEIAGPSPTNILEIQKKRGEPVNIRPKKWYVHQNKNFSNKSQFVEALHKSALHFAYPRSHNKSWLDSLEISYKKKTGNDFRTELADQKKD